MSGHGIGYPQSNPTPARGRLTRQLAAAPAVLRSPVVLPRQGMDIDAAQQLRCSRCRLWWQAGLAATLDGVTVSWLRAQES